MAATNSRTLDKALDLLISLGRDQGNSAFADIAQDVGIPFSTARRFGAVLESRGLIVRQKAGRYLPGPALLNMVESMPRRRVCTALARPYLATLSRDTGMTAHLGIFEEDMVTYICKEGEGLFTREDMQLEAYCSGIGKALLAALSEEALDRYLADGELVALTERTIVDPVLLRAELIQTRAQGWAMEDGEVVEGLACIAVPLRSPEGKVWAAISLSGRRQSFTEAGRQRYLKNLQKVAAELSRLPVMMDPVEA